MLTGYKYGLGDVGNNHFSDGQHLTEGCLPLIKFLFVYFNHSQVQDGNKWTDLCFPFKMQARLKNIRMEAFM
jgi:hypothetical protein